MKNAMNQNCVPVHVCDNKKETFTNPTNNKNMSKYFTMNEKISGYKGERMHRIWGTPSRLIKLMEPMIFLQFGSVYRNDQIKEKS